MGIGWTFGFIASFSDNLIMWWIFVAITSLYGLYLFITVSSSKRVKEAFAIRKQGKVPTNKITNMILKSVSHHGKNSLTSSTGSTKISMYNVVQ